MKLTKLPKKYSEEERDPTKYSEEERESMEKEDEEGKEWVRVAHVVRKPKDD